jgi:hypothetical protein
VRDDIIVSVVPAEVRPGTRTRGGQHNEFVIEIGVQKKLTGADYSEVDTLAQLAQQIRALFDNSRCIRDTIEATCIDGVLDPVADSEMLRDERIYTGLITARFMEAD